MVLSPSLWSACPLPHSLTEAGSFGRLMAQERSCTCCLGPAPGGVGGAGLGPQDLVLLSLGQQCCCISSTDAKVKVLVTGQGCPWTWLLANSGPPHRQPLPHSGQGKSPDVGPSHCADLRLPCCVLALLSSSIQIHFGGRDLMLPCPVYVLSPHILSACHLLGWSLCYIQFRYHLQEAYMGAF